MKMKLSGPIIVATLLAVLWITPPEVTAQTAQEIMRIRRIEATTTKGPQIQISGVPRSTRQKDWLQVEVQFETAPRWIDDLTFTYHIVLRNRRPEEGEREFNLFRGESSYVNIAATRDGKSIVYLHPSTLARYGTLDRVAVVVTSQGRVVAMASSPDSQQRWWETPPVPPISGFVLTRAQTPFALVNFDDFEAVKPSDR
jgi:hypothetical protein